MQKRISSILRQSIILITGGTGSFGTTVLEKLIDYDPKRVIIFSRDEKKQHDMRTRYDTPKVNFVIGDVRDSESVERVVRDGVDFIFHAAALKQVPSCEFFPLEAIKTNVFGTHNVIQAAIKHKVKRIVVLSTDKAVYPINAMGISKALMEKVMIADAKKILDYGSQKTVVCGVRYGNVLYSRGSVLPYFVELYKQGKYLTVTNFNMTRFLLPLAEASDLVFYAFLHGKNGDIYARKSPGATIRTLAEAVCAIFNYKKGYKEVGARAGEKLHETLVSQEEMQRAKEQKDYIRIPPESQGLDYNMYFYKGDTTKKMISPYTSENTKRLNVNETIRLLRKLPEIQEELRFLKKNGQNKIATFLRDHRNWLQ